MGRCGLRILVSHALDHSEEHTSRNIGAAARARARCLRDSIGYSRALARTPGGNVGPTLRSKPRLGRPLARTFIGAQRLHHALELLVELRDVPFPSGYIRGDLHSRK